jgi:hypothetical protein
MAGPFWSPVQLAKNHHYEFTSSVAAIKTDKGDADEMTRIREIPLRNFASEILKKNAHQTDAYNLLLLKVVQCHMS